MKHEKRIEDSELIEQLSKLSSLKAPESLKSRIRELDLPSFVYVPRVPLYNLRYGLGILLVILTTGSGAIVASEQSLPGSVLYPVKKAVEEVRLELTNDPALRAQLHVENADRRALELTETIHTESTQTLETVSADYTQEVHAAIEEIEKIENTKVTVAQNVTTHLETHTEVLQRVESNAPETAQAALQNAIEVSKTEKEKVSVIFLETPDPSPPPSPTPTPFTQNSPTPTPTADHILNIDINMGTSQVRVAL